MTECLISQHNPATKVAGRRLSVTTKHRTHRPEERSTVESEEKKQDNVDYPRPSHIAADAPNHHEHGHNNYEEEMHKKDRKPNSERKTREFAHMKNETTRPTRDHNVSQKTLNMRISQPAGKA